MFQKTAYTILLIILCTVTRAESIKIGILQNQKISTIDVSISNGAYDVIGKAGILFSVSKGQTITFTRSSTGVIAEWDGKTFNSVSLTMSISKKNSEFRITTRGHHTHYQDNLLLKNRKGNLLLINELNLDKYISGVVQAEVGNKRPFEYYKAQSVISRTYALSNKNKHETEGFHLCDQVHCQAFHGKALRNDSIVFAALETNNYVLTDHNIDLITTVFHSNCGGQTINSDIVWSKPLPYLKGVKDTFCLEMPNANWSKKIAYNKWTDYINRNKEEYNIDSINQTSSLASIPNCKVEYLDLGNGQIKNVDIRKDWKLKSAWFTICIEEDCIVLNGRGFGHGVGLCQEGAIRMAALGYSYTEILHFYYNDVHLIDLDYLDFFRD